MSNTNDYGSCLIYEDTAHTGCHLDILADHCHGLAAQPKEEVYKQLDQQLSQGRTFTFVHSESLALDLLQGWRRLGEDDFGRFEHFSPIDHRNRYVECKVGRAHSQGTTYVIHIFNRGWSEPTDYSCLLEIMIEVGVPSVTREILLLRSRMHAGLWAIYDEPDPIDVGSRLKDLLKDTEALVDVAHQREFRPGDEHIFGQLARAFRFEADLELLKAIGCKVTSDESRSFFRTTMHRAMERNLEETDRLYRRR